MYVHSVVSFHSFNTKYELKKKFEKYELKKKFEKSESTKVRKKLATLAGFLHF
jgi:hypothetical protein